MDDGGHRLTYRRRLILGHHVIIAVLISAMAVVLASVLVTVRKRGAALRARRAGRFGAPRYWRRVATSAGAGGCLGSVLAAGEGQPYPDRDDGQSADAAYQLDASR